MDYMKIIDYDNYYDGPLSGFCRYRGKLYYYTTQIWGGWEYLQPGPKSIEESRNWPDVCIPRIYGLRKIRWYHLFLRFFIPQKKRYGLQLVMVVSEIDRV